MIAALDAAYSGDVGCGACVLFEEWTSEEPAQVSTARVENVAPYIPGAFYERELPVLLAVLAAANTQPAALIVDGYVWLDAAGAPGLGAKLHEVVGAPVIGVAKSNYREDDWSARVLRGKGARPLYVTAAGMPVEEAASLITRMAGAARVPDMLHRADREARRGVGI